MFFFLPEVLLIKSRQSRLTEGCDSVTASQKDGTTFLPGLYWSSRHFPGAMSGRTASVLTPASTRGALIKARAAKTQVRAAVSPHVQLMKTWSGQGGERWSGGAAEKAAAYMSLSGAVDDRTAH